MKILRVILVVLAAVSWLSCRKSDEGSCSPKFLTRPNRPQNFSTYFFFMAPHLFVCCGSFGFSSVFSFSVFGFVLWLFVASLDVCFMLSVYVLPPHFRVLRAVACAAESCHKQISCRNKPEPGYICSDLRDSLLHMVITRVTKSSHNGVPPQWNEREVVQ